MTIVRYSPAQLVRSQYPIEFNDNGAGIQPLVSLGSFTAGETHLGAVGGHTKVIAVTPVLTVHATYVSGDYVGTSSAAMEFAGCARVVGGSGTIMGANLLDFALQSLAMELWMFNAAPTPPNDSAPWSISDADLLKFLGVIAHNTYYASAANSASPVPNQNIAFVCGVASTSLWGCLVTRGAPAYASGDLTEQLMVSQD